MIRVQIKNTYLDQCTEIEFSSWSQASHFIEGALLTSSNYISIVVTKGE